MNRFKISQDEINLIRMPERYSPFQTAKNIRLSTRNMLTSIDLDLTPYLKLPVFCIGKEIIELIMVIAPTQSGKTVVLQIAMADIIDQNAGTVFYCLPDEKSGAKALDEKIISMIKSSPFLAKYIDDPRELNMTKIKLRHMQILPAWSNSLASMNSTPAIAWFADEVRLFKQTIGEESNAIKQLQDRITVARSFGRGQGFIVSTPSHEGDLLHSQMLIAGTHVLYFYSKCPNCGRYQYINFTENLVRHQDMTVACECKYCHAPFTDADKKRSWNMDGQYGYEGQDGQKEVYLTPSSTVTQNYLFEHPESNPLRNRVCFRYNSFVSAFRSAERIWQEHMQTKDNIHDRRNFVQAWLAEFWKNSKSKLDKSALLSTVTDIPKLEVPVGTKVICAGVDTQDTGFYVSVYAFGFNMEYWLIDNFFLPCNTVTATPEELEEVLRRGVEDKSYKTIGGQIWQIANWAIDTGGHSTLNMYPALYRMRRVFMVKGRNSQATTIQESTKNNLFIVRTEDYLEELEQTCINENAHLYSNVEDEFLTQFLNIQKIEEINKKNGVSKIIWKKLGQNDYRMASVHAFICMDIATSNGLKFRQCTGLEDWEMNPRIIIQKIEQQVRESSLSVDYQDIDFGDDEDNYTFKGWG